ncbi:hypothetical protein [Pseudomonas synxantha]|uniref:hypothetical protein n=1 Tax=Pseudomonas synxantha TaxID=47883 RepID=UPI001179946E|nr:hypothetical protein [Pseudomonas synxantha]
MLINKTVTTPVDTFSQSGSAPTRTSTGLQLDRVSNEGTPLQSLFRKEAIYTTQEAVRELGRQALSVILKDAGTPLIEKLLNDHETDALALKKHAINLFVLKGHEGVRADERFKSACDGLLKAAQKYGECGKDGFAADFRGNRASFERHNKIDTLINGLIERHTAAVDTAVGYIYLNFLHDGLPKALMKLNGEVMPGPEAIASSRAKGNGTQQATDVLSGWIGDGVKAKTGEGLSKLILDQLSYLSLGTPPEADGPGSGPAPDEAGMGRGPEARSKPTGDDIGGRFLPNITVSPHIKGGDVNVSFDGLFELVNGLIRENKSLHEQLMAARNKEPSAGGTRAASTVTPDGLKSFDVPGEDFVDSGRTPERLLQRSLIGDRTEVLSSARITAENLLQDAFSGAVSGAESGQERYVKSTADSLRPSAAEPVVEPKLYKINHAVAQQVEYVEFETLDASQEQRFASDGGAQLEDFVDSGRTPERLLQRSLITDRAEVLSSERITAENSLQDAFSGAVSGAESGQERYVKSTADSLRPSGAEPVVEPQLSKINYAVAPQVEYVEFETLDASQEQRFASDGGAQLFAGNSLLTGGAVGAAQERGVASRVGMWEGAGPLPFSKGVPHFDYYRHLMPSVVPAGVVGSMVSFVSSKDANFFQEMASAFGGGGSTESQFLKGYIREGENPSIEPGKNATSDDRKAHVIYLELKRQCPEYAERFEKLHADYESRKKVDNKYERYTPVASFYPERRSSDPSTGTWRNKGLYLKPDFLSEKGLVAIDSAIQGTSADAVKKWHSAIDRAIQGVSPDAAALREHIKNVGDPSKAAPETEIGRIYRDVKRESKEFAWRLESIFSQKRLADSVEGGYLVGGQVPARPIISLESYKETRSHLGGIA